MDESFEAPTTEVADQPVEEATAPPAEGTSAVEAPFSENFDPNTLPDELQSAYKQMHGDYTRKTQELAEQRKEAENAVAFIQALQSDDQREAALQQLAEAIGPDAVLAALGYTEDDDEEPAEPVDPGAEALRRIEELEQRRVAAEAEAQQAQQLAAMQNHVNSEFAALAKELGVEDIPEEERELVVQAALMSDFENGMPQIRPAFERLNAVWERRQKDWVQSKQAQKASGGTPGVEKFNIHDPDETIKRMAAIMEANT